MSISPQRRNGVRRLELGQQLHPQINVVRAGVNYHFNWGAPAPVVAKY